MSALLLKLFYYYAWLHLSTLAHELGHAVVGRLVGFAPKKIQIGTGPGSFRFTVLGLECDFRLMPWGGFSMPSRYPSQGVSWRGALMVAAGPAADLCMLWLLVSCWPLVAGDSIRNSPSVHSEIQFLIMYQIVMFLYTVVPHDVTVEGRVVPNDGKQFLCYVTGKYAREIKAAHASAESYREAVARYEPHFQIENSWAAQAGQLERELLNEAEEAHDQSRYEEAIDKFERLLKDPKLIGGERACLLDGLACIPVMRGHDVPWEKTLAWIREAQALAPKSRTVQGTLGGALAQTGAYAEAIDILTPLTTSENEDVDQAVSSIFLAKAWDKQGEPKKAAEWLAKATELGGYEELRKRIAAELSAEARNHRA